MLPHDEVDSAVDGWIKCLRRYLTLVRRGLGRGDLHTLGSVCALSEVEVG